MIGGSISRRTMTYFAAALTWLLAALALMVASIGLPAADLAAPDTLVLVHVVCIGWLSLAMCGALFQFVPVLVATPLFREEWALPALGLLTAGLICLLAGFMVLGGRLPSALWVLPLGAVLLLVGFGLVVVDLAFAFLAAFGWLSGLVLAKLYKIVAFLTWLETYGSVMGRAPTPRVQDLVAENRATKWFAIYYLSVWTGTLALLAGEPGTFRMAAAAMTVGAVGIVHGIIRIRRLEDVASPLRLPAGAVAPHLLFAKT